MFNYSDHSDFNQAIALLVFSLEMGESLEEALLIIGYRFKHIEPQDVLQAYHQG